MRVVIQRVKKSTLTINNQTHASIKEGLVVFVGFEMNDTEADLNWMTHKLIHLRVMKDEQDKMNLSLQETKGELLLVSQFTLYASTKKGNRPSFVEAAKPVIAQGLYNRFLASLEANMDGRIASGVFGADMQVSLDNDGPVTIIIDSKNKTNDN
jgi:D-tyrosyl-tRNA(Tyr) deacylase